MISTTKAYELAKELYASIGVDTDKAIERLEKIPVSMHCWQGDDVRGFENPDGDLTGGIQTTGGGTMNTTNLDVETQGNSAAAIRSDRGGGMVNVDGGS